MKRLWPLVFLSVSLIGSLSGCQIYDSPPPDLSPAAPSKGVALVGNGSSAVWEIPFDGSWEITSRDPEWMSVRPRKGQGNIRLTIKTEPSRQLCGSTLTETITLKWTKNLVGMGSTNVKVRYTAQTGQSLALPSSLNNPDLGVVVQYKTPAAAQKMLRSSQARGGSLESRWVLVQGVPLEVLRRDPNVESAFANVALHTQDLHTQDLHTQDLSSFNPSDEFYPLQWVHRALNYPQVWGAYQNSNPSSDKPAIVAVLDSGIRYDHPDLAGRLILPGKGAMDLVGLSPGNNDGYGLDTDPTDPTAPTLADDPCLGRLLSSHGTHVTGEIIANTGTFASPCDNCSTTGGVGATLFSGVKVLPIRVINMFDSGDLFAVSSGIRYAAGEGVIIPDKINGDKTFVNPLASQVKVISMSLGGSGLQPPAIKQLCDAVTFAKSKGILVLAASGNAGIGSLYYPAACPDAVAVGSVGLKNTALEFERAPYSNYGDALTLVAPGGNSNNAFNGSSLRGEEFPDLIFSTDWEYQKNQPRYSGKEGTSQATPQVAALAALLFAKGIVSTPQQALDRLTSTALDLGAPGRDPEYGFGVIQPLKALGL
jgi:serine protease